MPRVSRHRVHRLAASGALSLLAWLAGAPAQAEPTTGFANLSLNQFSWQRTPGRPRSDFSYLEAEGGRRYAGGELYGFVDLEHTDRPVNPSSVFLKGQWRHSLAPGGGHEGLNLFTQAKLASNARWHESSLVLGLGYTVSVGRARFTPFLGPLYSDVRSGHSGWNGYQLGWALVLPIELAGQSLTLAHWNEFDGARQARYRPTGAGVSSLNGALSLSWRLSGPWAMALKLRYARDTLGAAGWTTGWIAGLRYDF